MRFHRLVLENLNSLYGEHTLDLDAGLGGAGLFLVHGPTGAGKSTLLDAICLALYGATPRFDGGTAVNAAVLDGLKPRDPRQCMSRGAGHCQAQVEFSRQEPSGERRRFRATWYTHRARKRADGKLQTSGRHLEERRDGAWTTLVDSSRERDFEGPFAEALQGLSFEDFQRTTLLAQFSFRQFLDADEKTRASLLERMTESGRFRELGRAAYERRQAADAHLRDLQGRLGARAVLGPEEEARRRQEHAATSARAEALQQTATRLRGLRDFWRTRAGLLEEGRRAEAALRAHGQVRAAHAADLVALEADLTAAPAREALAALRRARSDRDTAAAEHAGAAEEASRCALAEQAAAADAATGTRGRETASAALDEARPALAAATAAWQALEGARRAAREAEAQARRRALAAAEATRQRATAVSAAEDAARAHAEAQARLEAIPGHERLGAELGRLLDRHEALRQARTQQTSRRDQLRRLEAERAGQAARLAQTRAERGAREAALREAEAELAQRQRALEVLTADASYAEVLARTQAAQGAAEQGLASLAELQRGLEAAAALSAELAGARQQEAEATEAQRLAGLRLEELAQRQEADLRVVAEVEGHLRLLDQVLHVVAQRDVLQEAADCPLCGATEHPYRAHPERAPDVSAYRERRAETAARRAALEAALAATRSAQQGATAALAAAAATGSAAAESVARLGPRLEAALAAPANLAAALGLPPGPDLAARAALRDALQERRSASQAKGEALSRAARAVEDARRAVDAVAAASQAAAAALGSLETEAAARTARHETLAVEATALDGQLGAQEQELAEQLVALALPHAPVDAGVTEAQARAAALQRATAAFEATRQRREDSRRARELAAATAQRAEEEERAALAAAAAHAEAAAEALAATRAHLAGESPEEVRARLESALRAAAAAERGALDLHARQQRLLAGAQATVAARQETLAQAESTLARAACAFVEALASLGLEGEHEVDARSLGEPRRAELRGLREQLLREQSAAEGALAQAQRGLVEHGAQRPTGEPEDVDGAERLVALEEEQRVVEGERAAVQEQLGALGHALAEQEAALRARAALQQELAAAEEDALQWTRIAELIGTNAGEAFVTLVQALNLRAVIERANGRLARFLPRYELAQVVDADTHAPRLDFHLVDHWRQEDRRTVKSLSGGESFLVSLALALGLADLRAARLRIETLLIDEGFGSLDGETLQHVLGSLEALQQSSGAQIGLISHVEALREAIAAQVEVRPLGEGRSEVVLRA